MGSTIEEHLSAVERQLPSVHKQLHAEFHSVCFVLQLLLKACRPSQETVDGFDRTPYAAEEPTAARPLNHWLSVQVAFAAAKSMAVPRGVDEGSAAEGFAADLMNIWGVGDAACNDGVLLLLTLQPRQVSSA